MTSHPERFWASDVLDNLDWKPTCQCPEHPCGDPAAYIMHIHLINRCRSDEADAYGNRIVILCNTCMYKTQLVVQQKLDRMNKIISPYMDCIPECATCRAPMVQLTDVIREVKGLRP